MTSYSTQARVLYVDDNEDWRKQVGGLLEDAGYEVHTAATIDEAHKLLRQQSFHVAILDLRLDETDENNRGGRELAREIRGQSRSTKILLLTSSDRVDVDFMVEAGFEERYVDEFLFKSQLDSRFLSKLRQLQPPTVYLGTGAKRAVVAGVDQYDDTRYYPSLRVCRDDAADIVRCLCSNGYRTENVRLLLDAGCNQIKNALVEVADAAREEDLLVFFFSGHGDVTENKSHIVACDSYHKSLKYTGLPIDEVKSIIAGSSAQAKVIVLDACHSGAALGTPAAKAMSPQFMQHVFHQAEGVAILSSCKQREYSYEWPEKRRSVFTHYLLEALGGAADEETRKGFVTAHDAYQYVLAGVRQWGNDNGLSQTPTAEMKVSGDIIFTTQVE